MRQHIGSDVNVPSFQRDDLEAIKGINVRTARTLESLPDSRDVIVTSINGLVDDTNEIELQPILTFAEPTVPLDPILTNTRKLVGSDNVTFDVGPAEAVLDLSDTPVIPTVYGAADRLVVLSIDQKGRITGAAEIVLNSDNVHEGAAHLFFTNARARSALSGGSGIDYNSTSGVIALDTVAGVAGTYTPPTSITVDNHGRITAIA